MYQLKRSEFTKTLSVIMVLTLIFSYFAPTVSVKAETNQQMLQNQIIQETLEEFGISEDLDYALVEVQDNSSQNNFGTYSSKESNNQDLGIQIDRMEGETLISDIYVPYTETENGIENSFALAATNSTIYKTEEGTFANVYIKLTGYCGKFKVNPTSPTSWQYAYKPYSAQAQWSNSKDSGKVTSFTPEIYVVADKYNFNNSSQTWGSRIYGYWGNLRANEEFKKKTYTNPAAYTQYTSGALYNESSPYAFDINPHLEYEVTAVCHFTYRTAAGKTESKNISRVLVSKR